MKTLDEVEKIRKEVEAEFMRLPGVVGLGIGNRHVRGRKTNELAIYIFVKSKETTEMATLPRSIRGIPTEVFNRGPFQAPPDRKMAP